MLADLDICIAPLEMNSFCNSKSPVKYLESALVRVPVVATATEPFAAAIAQGETGFIAASDDEWYRYLKSLIEDKDRRFDIGRAAYSDTIRKYSPAIKQARLLEITGDWISASEVGEGMK